MWKKCIHSLDEETEDIDTVLDLLTYKMCCFISHIVNSCKYKDSNNLSIFTYMYVYGSMSPYFCLSSMYVPIVHPSRECDFI